MLLKRNIPLIFGVLIAATVHIASIHIPFMQTILRTEPLHFNEMLKVFVLADDTCHGALQTYETEISKRWIITPGCFSVLFHDKLAGSNSVIKINTNKINT